jgi:hypothetical protein
VRLASCHDWYHFCASTLPAPKKLTSKQIVDALPTAEKVVNGINPLPTQTEAERKTAQAAAHAEVDCAVTMEALAAAIERLVAAGDTPPSNDDVSDAEGNIEMADAEGDVEVAKMCDAEDKTAAVDEIECECDWANTENIESEDEQGDFASHANADDANNADDAHDADDADAATTCPASVPPLAVEERTRPAKRRRLKVREREILEQLPGQEASGSGLVRTWRQEAQRPGIFSASNYFYLYYALLPTRPELVPVGELANAGQCHGYLEEEANDDASSIKDSNSTYEFVGMSASDLTLLYLRTYTCACLVCRSPSTVSTEFSGCPNLGTVGKWRQAPACSAAGVVKQVAAKRGDAIAFAKVATCGGLYASYGAHSERGARPYWLLKLKKAAYQLKKKALVEGGTTLRMDTWVVDAQWYLSTSDAQNRKSYTLLEPIVQIPVSALIQEHGLVWVRETAHEPILMPASHDLLMLHNYSNVA